jgi:hypothetical protein
MKLTQKLAGVRKTGTDFWITKKIWPRPATPVRSVFIVTICLEFIFFRNLPRVRQGIALLNESFKLWVLVRLPDQSSSARHGRTAGLDRGEFLPPPAAPRIVLIWPHPQPLHLCHPQLDHRHVLHTLFTLDAAAALRWLCLILCWVKIPARELPGQNTCPDGYVRLC